MHLYEALTEYAKGEDYPYHMPGHKRRAFGAMPPETYRMDVTEIDGFDDLHAPEGLIKDLQSRIARLYGAEESFCLVGGSTCGILAAVSAAVSEGGHLLMARNCHKSAYHAAYLRGLKLTYLIPPEPVRPPSERVRDLAGAGTSGPRGRSFDRSGAHRITHLRGPDLSRAGDRKNRSFFWENSHRGRGARRTLRIVWCLS